MEQVTSLQLSGLQDTYRHSAHLACKAESSAAKTEHSLSSHLHHHLHTVPTPPPPTLPRHAPHRGTLCHTHHHHPHTSSPVSLRHHTEHQQRRLYGFDSFPRTYPGSEHCHCAAGRTECVRSTTGVPGRLSDHHHAHPLPPFPCTAIHDPSLLSTCSTFAASNTSSSVISASPPSTTSPTHPHTDPGPATAILIPSHPHTPHSPHPTSTDATHWLCTACIHTAHSSGPAYLSEHSDPCHLPPSPSSSSL
ncbi:hypothetical protein GBAR_LOCUS14716 [Geodia barretti]|uniref:Uncharacterized protein n=1 Tax=Geodia barretti TaxID=519541 RepID=A0AA35WSX0_GEOBA|nr:hypothetical protein GBAR_LOCUS14716 [Geodia barretti]